MKQIDITSMVKTLAKTNSTNKKHYWTSLALVEIRLKTCFRFSFFSLSRVLGLEVLASGFPKGMLCCCFYTPHKSVKPETSFCSGKIISFLCLVNHHVTVDVQFRLCHSAFFRDTEAHFKMVNLLKQLLYSSIPVSLMNWTSVVASVWMPYINWNVVGGIVHLCFTFYPWLWDVQMFSFNIRLGCFE